MNESALECYLRQLGCRRLIYPQKREVKYVLDEVSPFFFIVFDLTVCDDNPQPGTCDVMLAQPGKFPSDVDGIGVGICIAQGFDCASVSNLVTALNIKTKGNQQWHI